MGFVDDNDDLPNNKVDRRPVPPGESETKFITADNWNTLVVAAEDTRDWIRAATWYGLAAQAADPAPAGITNYVWLKSDGTLWKTVNGTATEIGSGGGFDNISETSSLITFAAPTNQQIDVGASQAYTHQVMMRGGGVPHTTEAVAIVGFVTSMTFATTSNAIGGQFKADATSEVGHVVTNIAVQGTARDGDANYSWYSTEGDMRQDGTCQFATTAGSKVTFGSGTVASADTIQVNKDTYWDSAAVVSLGSTVANFAVSGSSSENPNIRIGRPTSTPFQLALQNVKSAAAETGIAVHIDTTATSNARGGMRIYRSAGGSTQAGGFEIAGGTNSIITGTAANDVIMYARLSGARLGFGTGSTPTVRLNIDENGKVTVIDGTQGIEMGSSGPKWVSGSGSPEGAVSAPIGSLYSRTDGGTGTTLYVKEGGSTGNTGWVAK